MKRTTLAVALLLLSAGLYPASADDTQGSITAVDQDRMTITLSDGATYKLPPEMDMTDIAKGVEVVIAFRIDEKGSKQITDMFIPE